MTEQGCNSGAGLGYLTLVGLELVATLTRTGCEFFFSETMPVDWFCIVILPSSACRILDGKKGAVWLQLGSTTRCASLGGSCGMVRVARHVRLLL